MFKLTRTWRPIVALLFLAGVFILALTHRLHLIVPAIYLIASFISLILYAIDKSKARQNKWRTPEAALLTCDLLCGWPGGLLAQAFLRHKNQKTSYQFKYWLVVILNTLLLCVWTWPGVVGAMFK